MIRKKIHRTLEILLLGWISLVLGSLALVGLLEVIKMYL